MEAYRPIIVAIMDDSGCTDVLKIRGDLAWDTVCFITDAIDKIAGRKKVPLVVDLTELEFIDSRGISFLLRLRCEFEGKDVYLVSLPDDIRKVLERTFVLDQFEVYESVSEVEDLVRILQLIAS